ncbi:MAG TPA: glycoside hydrolase [Streptosporangiaceae bacterium]|nr:glycoside hydrolase [Streptosporangiaceae bacterium]
MRITAAEPTILFAGTASKPLQIMRVTVAPAAAGPVTVRVAGAGVRTPQPLRIDVTEPGAGHLAEVPVEVAAPHGPGSSLPVTVIAESGHERAQHDAMLTAAEPGWTVWLVSHFHYDPVWWNTQGQFTQSRLLLPDEDGALPESRTAFELVRLHLDAARADPDYKFVLAETDYLKPYFDAHPEDRADLRGFLAAGRIELVGGNYNEPNTNLTCAESTIRNAVYGIGQQRDVLGGDPHSAWMLDAFGFDPGYPGLMAAAGLTSSAWARGPFHQWGPWRTVGDNRRMPFATEFEWLSPDGNGLLTSYMANHYGAGWGVHQAPDLAAAQAAVLGQLALLAPVAATRNVLLPVGADHVIPARWATALHRDFAARYAWPRCVTALPREFFAAVRAEAAGRGIWLTPQTRDMNPVYPGKDVSYIDTKQAQRAAEVAALDGERLATLAWLMGAEYPAASLDKAWRLLAYGAHHDAITGTESDQVYLDLLAGWREAFERGDTARREAVAHLAGLADTRPPSASPGASWPVVVVNTLSWPRSGLAAITLAFPEPGPPWLALTDGTGAGVPFLADGVRRHGDGSLAEATVTFRADTVPPAGFRTYWAGPAPGPGHQGWTAVPGTVIGNETFRVEADPARGGALSSILDRRTGTELLRGPGNELMLQAEYDYHPRWGEGPWLLSPKGPGTGSAAAAATVRAERCPAGSRLVAGFTLGGLRVTQETILWDGLDQVQFRTHVDGSIGQDALLRVRFPADVPGALPLYQAATAVVGRPFGTADADAAEHAFTLDNPAHEWFGLGSAVRVVTGGQAWPMGVAEVIAPGPDPAVRGLLAALAGQGVTATCSQPDGPRYGALDLDSNLPDCRIALGGPDANPWTARLLASLAPAEAAGLAARLAGGQQRIWVPASRARAEVFRPSADVRGERDLPVLIVAGPAAAGELTRDLAGPVIEADLLAPPPDPPLAGYVVGLLNRGTPGSLVTPDGTLHIALMRASSAWPAGVWIDGPRRAVPDGSSFAWQHWSHTFEYALVAGAGDWREAGFGLAGQEYNHDLVTGRAGVHAGPLPPATSLCAVTTGGQPGPGAALATLKPRGNPLASGRPGQPSRADGVTVRLRDLAGRAGPAEVRLFPGLTDDQLTAAGLAGPHLTGAHLTDLLEHSDGPPLPVTAGAALVDVPAAGTVTLVLSPQPAPAPDGQRPADPAAPPEPAQPVFTRYWLHGKGPAPAGNLPVAVHLSPGRVALGPAGRGALRLTVACGPEPASGEVTLDVPAGLVVTAGGSPLRYELAGGGHACWDLVVRAAPDAGPGRYYLAAAIRDDLGQVLEDAALVTVGEPGAPALDLPLAELLPLLVTDEQLATAELGLRLAPATLRVGAGGQGELVAEISNRTAAPIRGECQLLSPHGSWPLLGRWTGGFAVGAGEIARLRYPFRLPPHARPGSHWWALAKVMYFGRVRYSECARIEVSGRAGRAGRRRPSPAGRTRRSR